MSPRFGSSATLFILFVLAAAWVGAMVSPPAAHAVSSGLVISQVYGGGGNAGATYKQDFIEIFNRGSGAVNLTGWTVQYAAAGSGTWATTALSGSVPAGGYYLIQEAQGTGGTLDLPTPDVIGSIPMSATSAKVALVDNSTALSGTCPVDPAIVDLVGYGSASCAEGSVTSTLSNLTAALRAFDGCQDTDDNSADFAELAPAPRSSSSLTRSCQYTLDVAVDPVAGGTVAKVPDQMSYQHGEGVQLTAAAAAGFNFINWSGDLTGSTNPETIVMEGDRSVTAHFAEPMVTQPIVISQIYGGGGNSGADYKNDYVELFNRGNVTVNVTGWSIQYASASGSTWFSTNLVGSIPAGRYFLVQQAAGAGGTLDLPSPDGIGTIGLSATDGKVALVSSSSLLIGSCPTGGAIQDFVGYGSANCSEGAVAAGPDNLTAAFRNDGGCVDTGDNLADLSILGPAPRNSATPPNYCSMWVGIGDRPDAAFGLVAVGPNPMRGSLEIGFAIPREARVKLAVLDLQGRVVTELEDSRLPAGRHTAAWNGTTSGGPARSGIYFVRLQVLGKTFARRVALMR
jgi:hypothetical protein